jgi:hypothetical protein
MNISREEYVEQQRMRVGEIAKGMLDGTVHYLEGTFELASLRHEIEVQENDEDLIVFVAVASEIDHLPIGEPRKYWSAEALARHEPEIVKAIEWAKEFSLSKCKSLVERFGA